MSKDISMKGIKTENVTITVTLFDAIEEIGLNLNFETTDYNSFITLNGEEDALVKKIDISRHGSPYYDTEVISNDPDVIQAFKAFKTLREYVRKI